MWSHFLFPVEDERLHFVPTTFCIWISVIQSDFRNQRFKNSKLLEAAYIVSTWDATASLTKIIH